MNETEIIVPGEAAPTTDTPAVVGTMSAAPVAVKRTRREFLYNGTRLADPDPKMTVGEVKEYYTKQFPELVNAKVVAFEGGTIETETSRREQWHFQQGVPTKTASAGGAVETHEFKRSVGTKG